ncbi:CopG family ribbon-helix-helix transcription regulator [Haloferax mucosum ATCC BAA-1512]|uniref:CopG family ribbon-helix-helix transcription regulator n=1 Tax=Haloferax mucosum ATCC BAA-1512 TaxID=662479 RepID=M0IMV0_9EURY|nr:ribbon-helix-helix protein, CopG family [Haloferax mucosum]ELZ98035.1 CopG family ribbon-helix-helix transcription regulator [Haloferax mucosum ATCC BAA-1512]
MVTNRITVSLDDDAETALDSLTRRTDKPQSEVVRNALTFYAANFEAATTEASANLEAYHQMLSSGEHVLLDIDFLHCFLDSVEDAEGDPAPAFVEAADRVASFHAHEYEERFDSLDEILDWLSFCGFLTVRASDGDVYHVVFPTESVKWFMTWFIEQSTERLPFDLDVEEGVSKAILTEVR